MKLTRTIIALGLSALTLAWTGCVTSVYPFYFGKDVAFDPALLDDWIENQNNANAYWKFERDGETAYRLTHTMRGLRAPGRFADSVFTLCRFLVLTLRLRYKSSGCLPNLAQVHLAAREAGQLVHAEKPVGARNP